MSKENTPGSFVERMKYAFPIAIVVCVIGFILAMPPAK